MGPTNPGQSFVVQAEQGDDGGHVFGTTDPPAHPARLRQHMMRARPAGRNPFVADPRRKRQVGQPVAVEMSNLAVVNGDLPPAEAVGLRHDTRPAEYLLRDRVGGLPHGASSEVPRLRRGGPVAGPQRDLRQRHHHQQRRQQQGSGVCINPRDAGAERRPEYLVQLRHRGPRYRGEYAAANAVQIDRSAHVYRQLGQHRGGTARELGGQDGGQDHAEDRRAYSGADLQEKLARGGGDSYLLVRNGVLDRQVEQWHRRSQPHAQHNHPPGYVPPDLIGGMSRQEAEPDGGNGKSGQHDAPVPPQPLPNQRGRERADDDGKRQRDQGRAGGRRGNAHDVDHKDGQEEDGREERRPDQHRGHADHGEGPVAEQIQRDDGGGDARLDDQQERGGDRRGDQQDHDGRRRPRVLLLVQWQGQQERDDRGNEQEGPRPVHRRAQTAVQPRHLRGNEGHRHDPDGEVDVKDPPPAQLVGEQAAEVGPHDAGQREDAAEQTLIARSVRRNEEVGNYGKCRRRQRGGADPLEDAERDQLPHGSRETGQRRPREKDHDAGQDDDPPAIQIGQLAVDRHRRRAGHQIAGGDPRQQVDAAQVGDDRRQRGGHDGLIERGQEQSHQHPGQDDPLRLWRQDAGVVDALGGGGRGHGTLEGGSSGTHAAIIRRRCYAVNSTLPYRTGVP